MINVSNYVVTAEVDLRVRTWTSALEENLGIKTVLVHAHEVPVLDLCAGCNLVIVDTMSFQEATDSLALDLCRHIRSRFYDPLLLITDHVTEDNLVEAYTIGIDECIAKSTSSALLTAKVRAWMRWAAMPAKRKARGADSGHSQIGYVLLAKDYLQLPVDDSV